MPRKKQPKKEYILGHEISLDDWLRAIHGGDYKRIYPNNCFPTDKHQAEYLSRIHEFDERDVKRLLRRFLNKSGYYGNDSERFTRVIEHYGAAVLIDDNFATEFDRRSTPKYGPQWEGLTWVIDLLPRNPLDAINAVRAYLHAHFWHMTDAMISGHSDVVAVIKSRYHVMTRHSCFISYGGPDEAFARRLYDSLTTHGVQAFFFPTDAVPGKRLHKLMREGVNQYDRIILICSKASLDRPGVLNELTETLQREARDGGKDYLIPIRLDDYVFTDWAPHEPQLAQAVRDRVVADFRDTASDEFKYTTALSRLIRALEQPHKAQGSPQ